MPVDGPSYLVGRTDERVLTMFCSGTNYQCLWTGPQGLQQICTRFGVGKQLRSNIQYVCQSTNNLFLRRNLSFEFHPPRKREL